MMKNLSFDLTVIGDQLATQPSDVFFCQNKILINDRRPENPWEPSEDVPMIQEAHVGVGVSGLQAASDGYQVQYLVHLSV